MISAAPLRGKSAAISIFPLATPIWGWALFFSWFSGCFAPFPHRHRPPVARLADEFRRTLLHELDYREEAQNLKTLGANRRTLATILFSEYALLGSLAGIIATTFAMTLSFIVSRYLMEIEWHFDARLVIVGVVTTTILVTLVGVTGNFGVLFKKPLATLSSQ